MLQRERIPAVHVITRFDSNQDLRTALLANFYDGARPRQLVLDYTKHLTINPSKKHMAANNLKLSNKIVIAFNLLPHAANLNESDVVIMVVEALTFPVKGKCNGTNAHMGESLNSFLVLNRHLEAIDHLHTTTSLKHKPSYYSKYRSIPKMRGATMARPTPLPTSFMPVWPKQSYTSISNNAKSSARKTTVTINIMDGQSIESATIYCI
jgi:hypothetical protein